MTFRLMRWTDIEWNQYVRDVYFGELFCVLVYMKYTGSTLF